jgi:hypothetical protein
MIYQAPIVHIEDLYAKYVYLLFGKRFFSKITVVTILSSFPQNRKDLTPSP